MSPESQDKLDQLVLVALLDPQAKMVKMVTMADLENLEIEVPLELRVHVVSPELLGFLE